VFPIGVQIYETYNPGHVYCVSLRDEASLAWIEVYMDETLAAIGRSTAPEQSRIFIPNLTLYELFIHCFIMLIS
jgi:hypothetical protein